MELIDTIPVTHQGAERLVMLFVGDLVSLPEHEAVDVLIVSAFPDDYLPTPTSLIGKLARAGVSVADLARDKEVDLRRFSSCWLSRPIESPLMHFQRILCFEPAHRGRAPEVVGDIFRSMFPFTTGSPPIRQIAMPLVAAGDQSERAEDMLEALTEASVRWLSAGLPIDRIKIVIRMSSDSKSLREVFAKVRQRHNPIAQEPQQRNFGFDVFVSYSQKNKEAVDELVRQLRSQRPALRVFMDRLELHPGAAWQQHIFESLDDSRKVICVYSPDYLASKVCQEEFNIAVLRHRESEKGVLLPLYLHNAELPSHMKIFQYEDAREADRERIALSADRFLTYL